jgi:ABC-2 type transporter
MTSGETEYDVEYAKSELYTKTKEALARYTTNPDPGKKIHFENEFAASSGTRSRLTNNRLTTIYWRSPNYNLSRIMVSGVIAVILSSVLVRDRMETVFSETQMRAQFAVIFLSFIITGIMSILSVLPVMLSIRDMFHRHRAAGMIGSGSLGWALGVAEKWFIIASSVIFVAIFLTVSYTGNQGIKGRIEFWVRQFICSLADERCRECFYSLQQSLARTGFLHLQPGPLFLFWPSLCLLLQANGHGSNPGERFHWTEQLLLGPDRATTVHGRVVCDYLLDHSRALCV